MELSKSDIGYAVKAAIEAESRQLDIVGRALHHHEVRWVVFWAMSGIFDGTRSELQQVTTRVMNLIRQSRAVID